MTQDAQPMLDYLRGLLLEYVAKNSKWGGECSSIHPDTQHDGNFLFVHHKWSPNIGDKKHQKVCVRHIRRFLAMLREKGFAISRRHTSPGPFGQSECWNIRLDEKDLHLKPLATALKEE